MSVLVFQIVIKQWDKGQSSPEHVAARAAIPIRYSVATKPAYYVLDKPCIVDQHGDDISTSVFKNGRIDRQFADADRRRSILNLSEKGLELHNEVAPLALQMESDLLADLSEDEVKVLDKVIDKLYAKSQMFAEAHQSAKP